MCQHLAAFLPATSEGRLTVNGVALVGERGALIAPAALRQWMAAIERRLNLRGLRVVDAPWVLLDPDTNEVVVPDPAAAGLAVEPEAFHALDDLAPSSRPDAAVAVGRYPLVGWAFTGDGEAMSRAQGVAFALRLTNNAAGLQPTLDALGAGDARHSPGQRRVGRAGEARRPARRGVGVTELEPGDIDEAFVPRPRGDVSFVELDNELVVAAPAGPFASDAHWLDRTASVVWNAFDGVTPLGVLVDELAAAFGADRDVVRDDVLELTRTLGRAGLLDGVAYVAPAVAHPLRPDGLPAGTALPAFTRRDLDGAVVRNEDLAGARWCAVNWSPSCGYCVNIAAELAEMVPGLDGHGCRAGPLRNRVGGREPPARRRRRAARPGPPRNAARPDRRRDRRRGRTGGRHRRRRSRVVHRHRDPFRVPGRCRGRRRDGARVRRGRSAGAAARSRRRPAPVTAAVDALVALVAAEGLPRREPPAPITLDDSTFATLLDAAARERITGHLDRALDAGWLRASDAQRDEALRRHESALSVDLILERLLVDTSTLLTRAGIRHRALKGPVVARTEYPDPALRSFGDVDILVDGAHFDAAVAHLERGGGHARYRQPRRNFNARFGKGVCVVTSDGLEIDLHRVFVAGPFGLAIDPSDLFADAEAVEIGGTAVPAPNASVRFLHACYHVALTSPRITATRDVAQIATRADLDVERALALAARWRGRAVVQRALRLTRNRLTADLDGPLYVWAERYRPDRFERAALRPYTSAGRSYAAQMAAGMWALRGFRARVEYATALLVPDRSYVRDREGSYVKRWARADRAHPRREGHPVTAAFSCLGFDFGVTATAPDLQRTVDALYAPFRAPVEVTTVFTLLERPAAGATGVSVLIFENDQQVRATTDRALALAHLVWQVSQHVIAAASESFLLLHAAAVERGNRAVLLPAPSGSGKSTLAAGLVTAGFGYLTDDVSAITLETGQIRPYPKPITLATEVVRQFERGGHHLLDDEARALMHTDAYVPCTAFGGRVGRESTAGTIVVPTYTVGRPTELTAMSRAEAVIVLGEQSFNFNELAPDALRLAADLVRACDCYRLTYSDLDAAVGLIAAAAPA